MRCTRPPAGGSGSWWAASCVPHAAQSVTKQNPERREPARPVEVDEPEPGLVFLAERTGSHAQPRVVDVLGRPARVPVEELVDGNDLSHL